MRINELYLMTRHSKNDNIYINDNGGTYNVD